MPKGIVQKLATRVLQSAAQLTLERVQLFIEIRQLLRAIKRVDAGDPAEAALIYGLITRLEKYLEGVKKQLKPGLVSFTKEHELTESVGKARKSLRLADGYGVIHVDTQTKTPKVDDLLALLRSKGLEALDGCDQVTTHIVSTAKLDRLCSEGRLRREDMDEITPTQVNLTVQLSDVAETMLRE